MVSEKQPNSEGTRADEIAGRIIRHADRDIVFAVQILGEGRNNLQQHFQDYIRVELARHDIDFGDHPLLLPFIETHARELTEFVTTGVGLEHQMTLQSFEKLSGDPQKLFRVDLWDSLRSHIERAEAHFVSHVDGVQKILEAVMEERALQRTGKAERNHGVERQ